MVAVPVHLRHELLNDAVAVAHSAHRTLLCVAQVVRDEHLQAGSVHGVEEGGVVSAGFPAVDANGGGAHRLDQRQVALPYPRILACEIITTRIERRALTHRYRAITHALNVERLAVHHQLPVDDLHERRLRLSSLLSTVMNDASGIQYCGTGCGCVWLGAG